MLKPRLNLLRIRQKTKTTEINIKTIKTKTKNLTIKT